MKLYYISVAEDFSPTPGGRYIKDGKWSGEEFRKTIVEPKLKDAIADGEKVHVKLDGTAGYATSFLEEAFGGLVRDLNKPINHHIEIVTENNLRKREVEKYISDAEARLK